MIIIVTTGMGRGATQIAAFDAALRQAGIADRNLIRLSSIIPPDSLVVPVSDSWECPGCYGDRLYVVLADGYFYGRGVCSAGIGWMQRKDGSGIFAESMGSDSVDNRQQELVSTLAEMSMAREGEWTMAKLQTAEIEESREWSCALVAAVYQSEGWDVPG